MLGDVVCLRCVTALAGGGEVLVYEQLGMTASRKKLAPMLQVQQNLDTDMFQCPRKLRTLRVEWCMRLWFVCSRRSSLCRTAKTRTLARTKLSCKPKAQDIVQAGMRDSVYGTGMLKSAACCSARNLPVCLRCVRDLLGSKNSCGINSCAAASIFDFILPFLKYSTSLFFAQQLPVTPTSE